MERKTTAERFWAGDFGALKSARSHAYDLMREGNALGAHSEMLSAYYSLVGGVSLLKQLRYFLRMRQHASRLYENWSLLSHNQLDVLLQFYVRAYQTSRFLSPALDQLLKLVQKEIFSAQKVGKPHQLALAYTTKAQIARMIYLKHEKEVGGTLRDFRYRASIVESVEYALGCEEVIRKERTVQALRQFVRVLKYCGEVLISIDNTRARDCLNRGLELASGEADTKDQVKKIQVILDRL